MSSIMVSVICMAYNHEKFIRSTLEGFVMQKTDFAYEVLINDDCSTDNTVAIIKEYEQKYPEIIKPVYQTENQHAKGVFILETILFPRVKGKYIAICDGDDCWTDPLKLQKQFDFLEANPDYVACFHNGKVKNISSGSEYIMPNIKDNKEFTTKEIITLTDGLFVWSSTFYRANLAPLPDSFRANGFTDFQRFVFWSTLGKVYCFKDIMSIYNNGHDSSWTARTLLDKEKHMQHFINIVDVLQRMDKYYDYKYHDAFQYKINWQLYHYFKSKEDTNALKQEAFQIFQNKKSTKLSFGQRLKIWIARRFPFVVSIKHKLKKKDK